MNFHCSVVKYDIFTSNDVKTKSIALLYESVPKSDILTRKNDEFKNSNNSFMKTLQMHIKKKIGIKKIQYL